MQLKDIEKLIDTTVLQYIKDICTQQELGKSEIQKIGQSQYVSRAKYKSIINQKKYNNLIREYYYNHIEKRKRISKKKKREKGKNITQEEALKMIFRDFLKTDTFKTVDKNKVERYLKTFLFNIDTETKTLGVPKVVSSVSKLLKATKKYSHFTPSLFIHHKHFTKEFLAYMGVIVLDFDLDESKYVMSKGELRKYIVKKLKSEPNLIWDTKTKGNYQACFLINRMVGTQLSIYLYEQIVNEMIHELGGITATKGFTDESGVSSNHIFSLPKNNKRQGKLTRKYHDKIKDIDSFKWLLDKRDKRRAQEQRSNIKVADFNEKWLFNQPAIKALMNGQVSKRNHAALTLALLFYSLDKPKEDCQLFFINKWLPSVNNDNFSHPFTENELNHVINHAYSGKYSGASSKWIQICTGIDFKYNIWKRYEPTGAYRMDTKQVIIQHFKNNNNTIVATQKELAETLNVSLRTLARYLSDMREEGMLTFKTNNAHNGKTIYTYQEQTKLTIEQQKSYKEELEQFEQLEQATAEALRYA